MAMKNDTAANSAEREALGNMADTVMILVREMVKSSEAQLQGSSKILQVGIAVSRDPTLVFSFWMPRASDDWRTLLWHWTLQLATCEK